jgi:hypothetical protein
VAKDAREVIDRVRVDEGNRLRNDRPARRLVKSARWLLLRNRDNVTRLGGAPFPARPFYDAVSLSSA